MKQRTSSISMMILGLVLLVLVVPAAAQSTSAAPQLPHTFYGKVEIDNFTAPEGLVVEATGAGVRSGTYNPVTTMAEGVYGSIGWTEQKLTIQGDIEPGTPITFYVGGVQAKVMAAGEGTELEAYPYIPGADTELNLYLTSQPAVGVTREPTPVQTRIPSGQVPSISGYIGPDLPQPDVVATYQPGEAPVDTQPTAPPEGASGQPSSQDGPESTATPTVPATTKSAPGMLPGTAIVAFLVIMGAAVYQRSRTKPEEKKEE